MKILKTTKKSLEALFRNLPASASHNGLFCMCSVACFKMDPTKTFCHFFSFHMI